MSFNVLFCGNLEVFETKIELQTHLNSIRKKGIRIGFVPTMGALHQGHMGLIRKSNADNDITVVSIFVNQLQFNNQTDFEKYPVSIDKDKLMLESEDCDILFLPTEKEMYPADYAPVELNLGILDTVLEGKMRPGHYNGVVQVVYRLFDYIKPDAAYFGLKDYQQCMVVKTLRNAFFRDLELHCCETGRHVSGLAMSSRNERLSAEGRKKAAHIYAVLQTVRRLSEHIVAPDAIRYGKHLLEEQGIAVEYLELAHADTLNAGNRWFKKGKNVLLAAVLIEDVRLIDNIVF